MSSPTLTNPVSVQDLLIIREVYRELRIERNDIFGELPHGTKWLRIRYLKTGTVRTLASVSFDPPTLSIHRYAFDYPHPLLLKGLLHHEMLHLSLGSELGHQPTYRRIESEWDRYDEYHDHRKRFVKFVEAKEIKAGRLREYKCRNCNSVIYRKRKLDSDSACTKCCDLFNNGNYSETYSFITVGISGKD
jgi:predicted SprT family Zn-dependent metalloprotease